MELKTGPDIERLGQEFRDKWLPRYIRHMGLKLTEHPRVYPERFEVKEWLAWTIAAMGGETRYCDPMAYSTSTFYCEHHCSVTVRSPGDFTVHSSCMMSSIYNNWEWGVGLGNYLLHPQDTGKSCYVGYHYDKDQWRPRRFAAALLLPRVEVFNELKQYGFNPAVLTSHNHEELALQYSGSIAGAFSVTRDPVKVRLEFLFHEVADARDEIRSAVTSA